MSSLPPPLPNHSFTTPLIFPPRIAPGTTTPLTASELPSSDNVYHLALRPDQVADNIIIVGDPDRVPKLAGRFLDQVEFDIQHRGLRTQTGIARGSGMRISIVTTGMGTPSEEIVLGELFALATYNLQTRMRVSQPRKLNIVRVGTSGGLQQDVELGTAIISDVAVGLDNSGLFYSVWGNRAVEEPIEQATEAALKAAMDPQGRFFGKIHPYATVCDPGLVRSLQQAALDLGVRHQVGVTASNSGFFCNQGRDIFNVPPSVPDIDKVLAAVNLPDGRRFQNMEMEASFAALFCAAHGYRFAAICPTVAHRPTDRWASDIDGKVMDAAAVALRALSSLPRRDLESS